MGNFFLQISYKRSYAFPTKYYIANLTTEYLRNTLTTEYLQITYELFSYETPTKYIRNIFLRNTYEMIFLQNSYGIE